MRSLRQRLAQFDRPAARPAIDRTGVPVPLDSVLDMDAQWVGNAPDGHLRREIAVEVEARRSEVLPREAWRRMGVDPPAAAGPWAILDTETTGLEGGAGTLVFLVGLVLWEEDRARLVQLLMPEPAAEASMLRELSHELERVDALISYNGRGFDVPRLRARMRLQRLDDAVLDRPHLDLLHPTRRLVRAWLPDCRLTSIEREILGRPRSDDLPGREAPEVYRTLLAERRDTGLDRVVRHNATDVENLLELGRWLAVAHLAHAGVPMPATARIALGRTLAARGATSEALGCLEQAVVEGDRVERRSARWHLALLHRRAGRFESARDVLMSLLEEHPHALDAHVELAKLYEHRLGDPAAARDWVLRAIRVDHDRRSLGLPSARSRARSEALGHRLRRLQRKVRGGQGTTHLRARRTRDERDGRTHG